MIYDIRYLPLMILSGVVLYSTFLVGAFLAIRVNWLASSAIGY